MTGPNFEPAPEADLFPRWQEQRNKFAVPGLLTPEDGRKIRSPEGKETGKLEDTVTMVFPQTVIVTRQDMSRVCFPAGINEVPVSIADHWYLKANHVKRYTKPAELDPPAKPAELDPPAKPADDGDAAKATSKKGGK